MATREREYDKLPTLSGPWRANNRALSQIIQGVRTFFFDVHISCTVEIATDDADAILNGGNAAALFSRIGIFENGYLRADWPMTMMHALTQRVAARLPADTVITAVTQGTYNLKTIVRIPCRWPWGVGGEVAYIEPNPQQNVFVFVTPWTDLSTANGLLLDPSATSTAAISDLEVRVYQSYDDKRIEAPPFFIPQFRTLNQNIAGAGSLVPFIVRSTDLLRGMMLETTATIGGFDNLLTPGCVTAYRIRDDLRYYLSDQPVDVNDLLHAETLEFAGDVIGEGADYFHNFQKWGMLSKVYNPRRAGTNLRYEIDQAVPAGATNIFANLGVMELVRIDGITAPGLPEGMEGI